MHKSHYLIAGLVNCTLKIYPRLFWHLQISKTLKLILSTNYCLKIPCSQLQLIPCLIFYPGNTPCLSDRIHSEGMTKLNFDHWSKFILSTVLQKNSICFPYDKHMGKETKPSLIMELYIK